MAEREEFLRRVAAAARAGLKHREPAATSADPIRLSPADGTPADRLIDELAKVGAYAAPVRSTSELSAALRTIVDRYSIRSAIINGFGIVGSLGVSDLLRSFAVEVIDHARLAALSEPERRDCLFSAGLGVAAPDWCIAETGSLVYAAAADQARSTSLLPPVHLAIVEPLSILADLLDLPAKLQTRLLDGIVPRNVVLITGPSKTGDIELKLTTGVHGPGEVHVLVWLPDRDEQIERAGR